MQTKHLSAIAVLVVVMSEWLAPRRAAAQLEGRSVSAEPSANAGDDSGYRQNFQIHAGWQPLFNGRDLTGWGMFLAQDGRGADPAGMIAVEDGVLRLNGDSADGRRVAEGYLATEQEYENYHLRLQYQWGRATPPPPAASRDSGVLYHVTGDGPPQPLSLQCEIREGNVGDLLTSPGLQLDSWVDPASKESRERTFLDPHFGGEPTVCGGTGTARQLKGGMNELLGWNTLEIVARGSSVTHILNGKILNHGEKVRNADAPDPQRPPPAARGKIALEIGGAPVQYRNIEIKQLAAEKRVDDRVDHAPSRPALDLRVGASAVDLRSDGTMVIAGGIEPHYAAEQEGQLRAVAAVIERPGDAKLAIVACDVLWVPRDLADAAVAEIERKTGISANCVLINATHTHHAPSTAPAHGFGVAPAFREELQRGIVRAVEVANSRLEGGEAQMYFHLGHEHTVGSNSRQLLEDGAITWSGQQLPSEKARPTAPFDPQLPILDFRDATGRTRALLFNHSTHTIGTRSGRDVRSPSFYGLAAQELEQELGGVVSFLEGASGSTHNVAPIVPVTDCIERIKGAVREARAEASARPVSHLAGARRPFKFHVRKFNNAEEDAKIARYMTKHAPQSAERVREVFAEMRRQLRDRQGAEQQTWIQAVVFGDVAIVGVPAEYFTVLGLEIKRRSPFEHTFVAELANDWMGYLPDREGHRLGGYQTWMGLHSFAEEGTGERMADEAVALLNELAADAASKKTSALRPSGSQSKSLEDESVNARGSQSPAAEQRSFQLADPDLKIELAACEPDVASPVALAWDADGRMYVAEMGGYPTTERRGRIQRLEDADGDGKYENAMTFCDGLNFPTSVMPYREGVLVTDAPDILYLEDADGDGRADVRRVEWTGFGVGSQQLRANSLHWGLDNWIYVANGRCDGDVRRPDAPADRATSIRARDFRFHPLARTGEATLGQSQFGQAHDAWGNRFLSWNTVPIRHVLLEDFDVRPFPAAAAEAVINLAVPSDTGQVFPVSPAPRQFNTEQANYYNALCGLTIFTGDALGPHYAGNAFVCESLTNLVTRRRLEPSGPTFVSRRDEHEANREFLASTDNWFHPVNLATGPDGALYLVDFYREFVEHPIYVADAAAAANVPWGNGAEHGRIWRIARIDAAASSADRRPQLQLASSGELVKFLGHPNAWWRTTAQRLLVERQDRTVVPQLRQLMAEFPSPLGRLHAMYALDGLDANQEPNQLGDQSAERQSRSLDVASLQTALRDPESNVRRHAVRLAADRTGEASQAAAAATEADRSDDPARDVASLRNTLLEMTNEQDAAVRFQLALAIGPHAGSDAPSALAKLLDQDDSPLMRLAVLCGIGRHPWPLMRELLEGADGTRQHTAFLEKASEHIGSEADENVLAECIDWMTADPTRSTRADGLAALAGLSRGMFARGASLRDLRLPSDLQSERSATGLREGIRIAAALAEDGGQSVEDRTRATVVAANGAPDEVERMVATLVQPVQPQSVQTAAVWAAAHANSPAAWNGLFSQWTSHTTVTRQEMLDQALRCTAGSQALVAALEAAIVSAEELPASTREVMGQWQDESLRRRAEALLAAVARDDRALVLARYADVVTRRGDAARGAALFKQSCQTCHAIQGVGRSVGPDLASVSARRSDLLLVDILDPSRQVSPDFVSYLAATKDGRVLSGVIAAETAESVTLRREEAQQETIPRSQLEQLRASGKSLMPDGLEKNLTPDQLVDLLEFLRRPDVKLLR